MEVSEQARIIAGRYRLESLIGEGGMASVWRARDATLERAVAVKLLFGRDERDQPRLVRQFLREARIAASVHHRNVIHIVDFGTTEEQQPFMVMELLEGETFGHRMHRDPPLEVTEIVHIATLTLRGLAAVHEAGIVHRDLKPDNVFLARDRSGTVFPKILDFGISRSAEPRSGRRSALTTREGMIVGTPEYMSPEQARGVRTLDKRSDIYSMGCILYEALTGVLPFECENIGDLIIQIVTSSAPRVHEVAPNVPRAISDVVAKAMARSPDDRFQDAVEMQQALLAAAVAPGGGLFASVPPDSTPPLVESRLRPLAVSSDRLRTLEFSIDEQPEPAGPSSEAEAGGRAAAPAGARPARFAALSGRVRAALATFALVAAAVTAVLVLGRFPGEQASVHAGAPGTAAALSTPPPPPPRTTIAVQLRNVPEGARVTVDGMPAEGSTIELPRDGRNRVIKVAADGKAPWQVVHHASNDALYDVWLAPTEAAPVRAASAQPTRRTATPQRRKPVKRPPPALRNLDF